MMRVLDLFSGIGGFSLGLERTGGFQTVAFCEIEPFCRRVLKKHWPTVPAFEDVRSLRGNEDGEVGYVLATGGIRWFDFGPIDVICGGFPCQDISLAGSGAGLDGERSGLWSEIARLTGELRPRYLIVENVSALLDRGLDRVLGDLAALGFDGEWHCIPASAIGAPHRRDRFWLVANNGGSHVPDADSVNGGSGRAGRSPASRERQPQPERSFQNLSDADDAGRPQQWGRFAIEQEQFAAECRRWWGVEPDVGRVAHGVPSRVDRLRALGNAVVPQIPEMIGRAILAAEARPIMEAAE